MATYCTVRLVIRRLVGVKKAYRFIITALPRCTTEVFAQFLPLDYSSIFSPRTIGTKVTLSPRVLLLFPIYGQSTILSFIFHSSITMGISGR